MTTESTKTNAFEKAVAIRSLQGPLCAECGHATCLLHLNDKSVLVDARMAQVGDTLVFVLHRCPTRSDPQPPKSRRFRR